jgi:hypothetical protein
MLRVGFEATIIVLERAKTFRAEFRAVTVIDNSCGYCCFSNMGALPMECRVFELTLGHQHHRNKVLSS